MNTEKIVVGLDIGTTKICAIVGQMTEHGKINVIGMGQAPSLGGVAKGEVTNISRTVEAIDKAIKDAGLKTNIKINSVYVGIAGSHINSMQHPGLRIRQDGTAEITREEIQQMENDMQRLAIEPGTEIMHILPQEYNIDNVNIVKDPVGYLGVRLEGNFHIITGKISAAKNILTCVERVGVGVEDLVVEPIASAKSVLSKEEMESGVCLVDIGGGTSDIAIFKKGSIRHTAVIPKGGNYITHDIQEAFGVLQNQAEALKHRFGNALPEMTNSNEIVTVPGLTGRRPKEIMVKNLSKVINAAVLDIIDEIDRQIFLSGYEGELGAGIVLTGGGSQLKYLDRLMERETATEVNLGSPNQHLAQGLVKEVKSPMYATGVGLVLYGFEQDRQKNQNKRTPREATRAKEKKKIDFLSKIRGIGSGIENWLKDEDLEDFNS